MSKIRVKTRQKTVELDSNTYYNAIIRSEEEIVIGKFNSSFLMLHYHENIIDISLEPFKSMVHLSDFVSRAALGNSQQ